MLAQLRDLAERMAQSAEQLGRPDLAEMARAAVRAENEPAPVQRISVMPAQAPAFTIAEFDGRCPFCVHEAVSSRLLDTGSMRTAMGFRTYYDETGQLHAHDPNKTRRGFECSNGHLFVMTMIKPCPNCDYGKDTTTIEEQRLKTLEPL